MNDNPYTPPQSQLTEPSQPSQNDFYYKVSLKKFLILSIVTVGLYEIYWMYKQWQGAHIKQGKPNRFTAAVKAIFSILFIMPLFNNLEKELKEEQNYHWKATPWAGLYILAILIDIVANSFIPKDYLIVTEVVFIVSLLIRVGVLYIAQQAINQLEVENNAQFTPANKVWCFFGLVMWFAYIAGTVVEAYQDLPINLTL